MAGVLDEYAPPELRNASADEREGKTLAEARALYKKAGALMGHMATNLIRVGSTKPELRNPSADEREGKSADFPSRMCIRE